LIFTKDSFAPNIPKKCLIFIDFSSDPYSDRILLYDLLLKALLKLNFIPVSPIMEFLGGITPIVSSYLIGVSFEKLFV
jgi:hypothetical protein